MADRQLVVCSVLCFSLKKYGKHPMKMLKSMLIDFYDVDAICSAKQQLLVDVEVLNSADKLINKLPNVPTRRSGEDRLAREVDDIFTLITYLDESRMISSLPKYVSDDPDGMPSSRLYEGDLHSLLEHLSKIDQKVAIFDDKLNLVVQHLHMYASSWPALGAGPGLSARPAVVSAPSHTAMSRDRHDIQQVSSVGWGAADSELSVQDDDNSGQWQLVQSSSKRRRRSVSDQQQQQYAAGVHRSSVQLDNAPKVASTVASTSSRPGDHTTDRGSSAARRSTGGGDGRNTNNRQQERQQQQQQQQQRSASRKSVTVIGRSNTVHGKITAAKPYVAKSVYCVDNVLKDVSESDMVSFLRQNGISVINCHAVKPRRSAWQRHRGIVPKDRAAFRICIAREDSSRLLSEDLWPAHVCVSSWRFKKRDNEEQHLEEAIEAEMETHDPDAVLSDQENDDNSGTNDNGDDTIVYADRNNGGHDSETC